jgi:hypothetical protein
MEIEDNNRVKYWRVIDKGEYCSIYCDVMHDGVDDFYTKRKIYEEFIQLESELKKRYKWWNAYTKLDYPLIMRFMAKKGANPYYINLKTNAIWFSKRLS